MPRAASACAHPPARSTPRCRWRSATSHPGVIDFADEMGIGSIVLLDEASEQALERLADTAVTPILSIGTDGIADWGERCARRLIELGVPLAIGTGDDVGPLEPGKRADLLILNTSSYARLPYEVSDDPIRAVVKDGWLVVDQGARVA